MERIVAACPSDEQHELGIRMLGDVLEADRWDVHVLGARTPVAALVPYVEKVAPAAVALSCGTPIAIPSLIQAAGALGGAVRGAGTAADAPPGGGVTATRR